MIFLYQELSRQSYATIQNFSFIHVMSGIIIFDFFMCFLWGNKNPHHERWCPVMADLGIIASTDLVANDQAFVDMIYASIFAVCK